jgi:hypothetical protein
MKNSILVILFFNLILVEMAFASPAKISVGAVPSETAIYSMAEYTINLAKPPIGNPFTDATLVGLFTQPGKGPIKVEGFCDEANGKVFKLRFMPLEAANYKVQLIFNWGKNDFTFNTSLTVNNAVCKGMLRVDPQNPYHFIWSGTSEHYFWNGTTSYLLFGWQNGQTIYHILDRLDSLKVNHMRTALCGRIRDGKSWSEPKLKNTDNFSMQLSPWLVDNKDSIENITFDPSRFDLNYWHKIDKALQYARNKDMILSIIFYLDGARTNAQPFKSDTGGGMLEKLYYRYAIARLAAYSNVIWDVSNEYRLFRSDDWAEKMGAFVKATDPYKHLTSIHGFPYFQFRKSEWADFAYYQEWDNAGGYNFMLANRLQQEQTGRPIPQVNEEYGYEDHYPDFSFDKICPPGRDGDNRRRLAWRICMAGGYQTTGESAKNGNEADGSPCGGWINGLGKGSSTMLKGNAAMRKIFEQTEWWKLTPENNIINHGGYCLCLHGKQYLLYVVWGYIKVKLVPGKYEVTVFKASDASVIEKSTIEASTLEKKFKDWQTDYAIFINRME